MNNKKEILKDWLEAFPELNNYSQNKIYKILGPLVIGIELIKLPRIDHYRPHFVVYSLIGNDIGIDLKSCLSLPIMLQEFYDLKGLQISIPYEKHSKEFPAVVKTIRKKLPISTEGDIKLKKVILAIKEYSQKPTLSLSPNSYLQARLHEALLKITIYYGEDRYINPILETIKSKPWKKEHFNLFKVDLYIWLKKIESENNKRDEFLKIVELNKNDQKLSKLNISKILD